MAKPALFTALLELADDQLILGHRLSEWCGKGPILEEDLAMSNLALDLIGQARNLYAYAGKVEGKGRSEDDLAYLRLEAEYTNCLLVERSNGDFAHTMLRQLYFAAFMQAYWQAALALGDEVVRGIAGKSVKEMAYHVRHCAEWVIRLGDGTEESARRMADAVEALHIYTGEMFEMSAAAAECAKNGVLPNRADLRDGWQTSIDDIFAQAMLSAPVVAYPQTGGRYGQHTEAMGHILAELQYVQRTHPGLRW